MSIVRKNQEIWLVEGDRNTKTVYSIRYETPHNSSPFFLAVPANQHGLKEMPGIDWFEPRSGSAVYGFKGATEKEAKQKMEELLLEELSVGKVETKVILLSNHAGYHNRWGRDIQETITFSFVVALKREMRGKTVYYECERDNPDKVSSSTTSEKDKGEVPFTPERHKACLAIIEGMKKMQERINDLCVNQAEKMLDGKVSLLALPLSTVK